MLSRKTFIAGLAAGAAALAAGFAASPAQAQGQAPLKEINFGIISTESAQNLRRVWDPFLADMQKKVGIPVKAFFAPDYAGVIQGMRFNKVQIAWYGNASAIQAVDQASGEVFVQSVDVAGNPGYWSLLITHKDSPLNSLEDVIKRGRDLTFGNGDPNSTSGFVVPSYYAWAVNKIDPRTHFKRVVTASHETNALAVANKQVDFATNNTESMDRLQKTAPAARAQIKEIWRSPLIPSDPIVWRKDLADSDKQKIRNFFLEYGVKGPNVEAERKVLAGLQWAPFRESSNRQLLPIRQLNLFREKGRVEANKNMSEADRKKRLAEIDRQLADLQRQMATN